MIKGPSATKRKHKTQAANATTKRKHQTLSLMGATRPASVFSAASSRVKMQCLYTKQRLTDSTNYTHVCEPLP